MKELDNDGDDDSASTSLVSTGDDDASDRHLLDFFFAFMPIFCSTDRADSERREVLLPLVGTIEFIFFVVSESFDGDNEDIYNVFKRSPSSTLKKGQNSFVCCCALSDLFDWTLILSLVLPPLLHLRIPHLEVASQLLSS